MHRTRAFSFFLCLGVVAVLVGVPSDRSTVLAQKGRRPPKKTVSEPSSPIAGKEIQITLTDGGQITGKFVKIDSRELTYENAVGDKIPVAIERIAILAIGEPPKPKIDFSFISDAESAISVVAKLSALTDATGDQALTYREYTQKVTEAKVAVESFIAKHSEFSEQQPLFTAMRKITDSYEMVSPIWAMRIGADQRKSLSGESPEMVLVLNTYPELKLTEYNREGRYPTDKVVAWVWSQIPTQIQSVRSQIRQLRGSLEGS